MLHSTTTTSQPSTKSLLYITTFARVYTPDAHNESLARSLAQKFSNDTNDDSYKQLSWTKDSCCTPLQNQLCNSSLGFNKGGLKARPC